MKPFLLRLHRWTTLIFALPLAVVILTGLVLSFEPILQDQAARGLFLPASRLEALLGEHDPAGKARGITVRAYENRLVLSGVGADGSTEIDLATGKLAEDGGYTLSDLFGDARRLHEHFLFDLEFVVTASTIAMMVLILLGVVMGWPRIRNTMSGWHQGMAWGLLPLLILSPVTGLMLAFGVTLQGPLPPQDRSANPTIREAVALLAKDEAGQPRDLGGLIWLRNRGGRLLARIDESGRFNVYAVSRAGVRLTPTNWPRGLHEGNAFGTWTGLMVVITSFAFVGLMGTGLTVWVRRTFLRKRNRQRGAQMPSPAA